MTGARGLALALALALALLPGAGRAQEVGGCDPAPPVTDLIEPWEDTTAALAEGAVRLAVLEGEEGTRRLLALTLPPPEPAAEGALQSAPQGAPGATGEGAAEAPEAIADAPVDATVASDPEAPPPERRCRIVAEGALGFADLDLAGLDASEDPEAGTLTVRVPALGFVPESTELRPQTLVLTFGVADGSLAAALE